MAKVIEFPNTGGEKTLDYTIREGCEDISVGIKIREKDPNTDWLTVSVVDTDKKFKFVATKNTEQSVRTATVVPTVDDEECENNLISVTQAKGDPCTCSATAKFTEQSPLEYNPSTSQIEVATYTVAETCAQSQWTLVYNGSTPSIIDMSKTYTISDGKIKAYVTKNTTTQQRVCEYTVKFGEGCSAKFTLYQTYLGCTCSATAKFTQQSPLDYNPSTDNQIEVATYTVSETCTAQQWSLVGNNPGIIDMNKDINISGNKIMAYVTQNSSTQQRHDDYTVKFGDDCSANFTLYQKALECNCNDIKELNFDGNWRYFNMDGTPGFYDSSSSDWGTHTACKTTWSVPCTNGCECWWYRIGSFKYEGTCTPKLKKYNDSDGYSLELKKNGTTYYIWAHVDAVTQTETEPSTLFEYKIMLNDDIPCKEGSANGCYIGRIRWRGTDDGNDHFKISATEEKVIIHPSISMSCRPNTSDFSPSEPGYDSFIVDASKTYYIDTENIFPANIRDATTGRIKLADWANDWNGGNGYAIYINFAGNKVRALASNAGAPADAWARIWYDNRTGYSTYGQGAIYAQTLRNIPTNASGIMPSTAWNGGGYVQGKLNFETTATHIITRSSAPHPPHEGREAIDAWDWFLWGAPEGKSWCRPDGHSTTYTIVSNCTECKQMVENQGYKFDTECENGKTKTKKYKSCKDGCDCFPNNICPDC